MAPMTIAYSVNSAGDYEEGTYGLKAALATGLRGAVVAIGGGV